MHSRIRLILVEPSYPANIGASARAMKTMGLSKLTLVAPAIFPSPLASATAAHAHDILDKARVVQTLDEALVNQTLIFSTTGRTHDLNLPRLSPQEAAERIANPAHEAENVAIIFGRESSGLKNTEVLKSHAQITIPTHAEYDSLNLSQAVQIICYELWLRLKEKEAPPKEPPMLANGDSTTRFYHHLEQLLFRIGFLRGADEHLMNKLRALFQRAALTQSDVNILRGILSEIEKRLRHE